MPRKSTLEIGDLVQLNATGRIYKLSHFWDKIGIVIGFSENEYSGKQLVEIVWFGSGYTKFSHKIYAKRLKKVR